MQVSLEWQALEQNKGFFRRTTTWILFRMCTKEETALNILQARKKECALSKKFCGIDLTDAFGDDLMPFEVHSCVWIFCVSECLDRHLSYHPVVCSANERIGMYASGIVFCNAFFFFCAQIFPRHSSPPVVTAHCALLSFSFISCIAPTSFNLEDVPFSFFFFLSRAVKFTANHLMHQSLESLHMSKMGFRDVTAKYFNPCPAGIESGACGPLNSLC